MMSFKKNGNKVNNQDKAKLEHKLYLARENPEPIFDISDCNVKAVPNGIYSLCKVFRKKELKMMKNKLSSLSGGGMITDLSLLTILDLSDNEFDSLPSEINYLKSLEEFYLQNNCLKKLPKELTELTKLIIINVSNNKLKSLPENMNNLKNLNTLDISNNKITKLPKSLGMLEHLETINFDGLSIEYPPGDIVQQGLVAILIFLAKECGINCDKISEINNKVSDSNQSIKLKNKDDKIEERRQNDLLELEKTIKNHQQYELELQSLHNDNKKKLLVNLAEQQTKLEIEITKVQQEREINRSRLLSFIYDTEKDADGIIKEFLSTSEAERQTQAELLEREKNEQMGILSKCHNDQSACRTKETLHSMELLLQEELLAEKKIEEYTKYRDSNAQSLLSVELINNNHLAEVVKDQKKDRDDLIDKIKNDEILQKAALVGLLEKSDTRSWSIVQQVNLVQSQLVALTNIELERKKLQVNQQINDLADKRVILSEILIDLLNQQEKRRGQLMETIDQMEKKREKDNSLFWLMQYQSLMEVRPQGLLEGLEPTLVRHVAIAGALHCLPFLSTLPGMLPHVTHDDLIEIGINNENDRCAVILAANNYLAEINMLDSSTTKINEPSTSDTNNQDNKSTMSSISSTECVVCFDSECQVIFLPCGHLCCCENCSNMVTTECPMCRTLIQRKIQVRKP
ncbi:hypothetical protein HCN44_000884 [Aphidius gifuensis]|uniref:RING-type domain-containing protein n=1 Tax=Aphidius gifuensis TaxID=684658 RepID=A0A834XLR5_APHGI|nr:E3 ubiquitin-protein ligase LRSAM1-like isoform X2 [Aphidius gifuensis]KAF7988311.1 hypothetical protein HCN44_000884 [Aphidius gifuensis]